jgi:hypothetical protein
MIARIWRGWAPLASADDYQRHYETEVREHLRAVNGFRGAREAARRALSHWDERVSHHEVVAEVG